MRKLRSVKEIVVNILFLLIVIGMVFGVASLIAITSSIGVIILGYLLVCGSFCMWIDRNIKK